MGSSLSEMESEGKGSAARSPVVESNGRAEEMKSGESVDIRYLRGSQTARKIVTADFGEPTTVAPTINYTFVWNGQNHELILAGSFLDNWNGRERMERKGNQWVYSINLERKKHFYKFVVDGVWRCDDNAPKESDNCGNTNNVLDLELKSRPVYEINENREYYVGRPPEDHFDLNAQAVPIHFTKNILNSKSQAKLSENNVYYKFSDSSENMSFKYFPPPPHVILKHASFLKTENEDVTVSATTERMINKYITLVYYNPKIK